MNAKPAMSPESPEMSRTRKRVAVIGGGISGLATCHLLAGRHSVTLFEERARLGGHARTVLAGKHGRQPVDTGFIVFNHVNYPLLAGLFLDLDVPVKRSDMSFAVSIDRGRVEYGLRSLRTLFAAPRSLVQPSHYRMISDILRFHRQAETAVEDADLTLAELVSRLRLGRSFLAHYLLPICGAIWSTPPREACEFPARAILRFMRNHGLLGRTGRHQWWTVDGGSREYVRRLEMSLHARGVKTLTACGVRAVERVPHGARLHSPRGAEEFDDVVLACHSDQALRLLSRATAKERSALSDIRYQPNRAWLHADPRLMPRRRSAWSSWVYLRETRSAEGAIGVSYWMNRLQAIPDDDPLFVTLNPPTEVRQEFTYDETTFAHPLLDRKALSAQSRIARIQGENHTWFAGAYLRNGFHEDGFASAARIDRLIDAGRRAGGA